MKNLPGLKTMSHGRRILKLHIVLNANLISYAQIDAYSFIKDYKNYNILDLPFRWRWDSTLNWSNCIFYTRKGKKVWFQ